MPTKCNFIFTKKQNKTKMTTYYQRNFGRSLAKCTIQYFIAIMFIITR